ncbi:MAG: hypothetical protein WAJ93_00125 [Candidatus Nitrosopolaris sp.]
MVTSKQRTIAISAIAIVAVLVLFASAPLVATHQAHAFWAAAAAAAVAGKQPTLFFIFYFYDD